MIRVSVIVRFTVEVMFRFIIQSLNFDWRLMVRISLDLRFEVFNTNNELWILKKGFFNQNTFLRIWKCLEIGF